MLQVGRRALGMAEEDYRALLSRHGAREKNGRFSATTMSVGGLMQAVAEMKQKGFRPRAGGKSTKQQAGDWRRPQIEKIRALWLELHFAGVVHSSQDIAMERWCGRVTGKARLEWCSARELAHCIEGLKSWARREGLMR